VTCSRQMQMQCAALRCAVPEARVVVVMVVVVQTLSTYLCVIQIPTYPVQHRQGASSHTIYLPTTVPTLPSTYPHLNIPRPQ
jgi:hypothetical protein